MTHTRIPYGENGKNKGIQSYSFDLNSEASQPCGSLNFSRIDTAILKFNLANINSSNHGTIYIYARNYNLLRIASGMGGLAYA